MNTLKIQILLIDIIQILREADVPPEVRIDVGRKITKISDLIIEGLESELKTLKERN